MSTWHGPEFGRRALRQGRLLAAVAVLGALAGLAGEVARPASSLASQAPSSADPSQIVRIHKGVYLYWHEPVSGGGITGYDIQHRSGTSGAWGNWSDVTFSGTTQPAVVTGLNAGTTYQFRVRGENARGKGAWSQAPESDDDPARVVTVAASSSGTPNTVRSVSAEAGDGQVTVTWTAPHARKGAAVTGYTVLWRYYDDDNNAHSDSASSIAAGAASYTITGLENGRAYDVWMRAHAAGRRSRDSMVVYDVTPKGGATPTPTASPTPTATPTPGPRVIGSIAPRGGGAVTVAPGETVRLDLDLFDQDGGAVSIDALRRAPVIAWYIPLAVYADARQDEARVRVVFEDALPDQHPTAPLAGVAGARGSALHGAPADASGQVVVRAVTAAADCPGGGGGTDSNAAAAWDGPCSAEFTISIVAPPTPGTCTQTTLGVDPGSNTVLAADCAALLRAKDGLRGTATLNWSAGTALTGWDGVTLGGTPRRVTGLSLTLRGLTGSIPTELGGLTALRTLNLSGNKLVGAVPAELGSLTELRSLNLSRNRLTGSIPWELSKLGQLESIFLAENQFTGCVPRPLRAVASHDLDRLGLKTCALSLAEPEEGVASVLVPATLQSAIIDDLLAAARARRAALQSSLAAGESSAGAATARAESAALDAEIARLEAIDRTSLVGFNVDIPYVTVRDGRGGDGIAFSKFTYEGKGDASTPIGITEKDPTQFVLWGEATRQNVGDGFRSHTRLPEGLYRWENDRSGACIVGSQYVAMRNAASASGQWVWAESDGLQTVNDTCAADERHHMRFFASDDSKLGRSLGEDPEFVHWTVVSAHFDARTSLLGHEIRKGGWEAGELRVLRSLTTPHHAVKLDWVGQIHRQSFGNAESYESPEKIGPQDVVHDGDGYVIQMLDLPEGDPEPLARPSAPRVTTTHDSITVFRPLGPGMVSHPAARP